MRPNSRLQIVLTVIAVPIVLIAAFVVGLFLYVNATARPLHPDANALSAVTYSNPATKWAEAVEQGRQRARAGLLEQNLPGLSVAVGAGGDLIWAEGLGYADLEKKTPVRPETRFEIGTASVALTSAAVGLLLEKERLHLDADIQTVVSAFPEKQWPVTLRQLMAHTAGVRNDAGDEEPISQHCERTADGLKRFADDALRFEPGTEFRFSSYGWILVSAAVEAAGNEPFFTFMQKQVFAPLGMRDTAAAATTDPMPDLATSYFPRFGADPRYGPQEPERFDASCFAGAGAFVSTPSDLVRFAMALNSGKLLKPATVQLLQSSQRLPSGEETGYGLGWNLESVTIAGKQTPLVGHDGTVRGGMAASFMTLPEHGLAVAVTSNTSFADTYSIAVKIAEAFAERRKTQAGPVRPGLEVFLADLPPAVRGKRIALITNHSAIDRTGAPAIDLIAARKDVKLVALLAAEHGIRGTAAAGEKISDAVDVKTGLPIYSLYTSEDRGPTPAMLEGVDAVVYDLQEVGGRTWTYVSTMALSMQAAARKGIPFVVLDRPNPIGGEIVEGALLDPKFKSFVGMYPIPARHGMTVGELAMMFNRQFGIGADLVVVRAANWRRSQWFDDTGLPWTNPSPNLRSFDALKSYPGTVYFEGTNLTEGRGTDRPFEQVGAPWLDAPAVARTMNEMRLPGVRFEAIAMPVSATAAKFKGQTVPAIRFAVTDARAYRPVRTALLLIDTIKRQHPGEFAWGPSIDRLTGSDEVRLAIDGGRLPALLEEWDREAAAFAASRAPYLLYE